jgi:signal transduction histidine kinase/CheY-like chemotaxis protein
MIDAISCRRFHWIRLCLLLFVPFLPFLAFAVGAAALDVTQSQKIVADAALSWCATERSVTFAEARGEACPLQPAQPGDLARGLDRRAFWLQVKLINPSREAVERWVFVGHPRLEEISLFEHDETKGWQSRHLGIRTPLAKRDEIGRAYGVIPVVLPPAAEKTVWLRVASRTAIDLSTTLWAPAEFREASGRNQFSLTLALDALFVVMLLSGVAFLATREWPYFFFAVSMLGEILLEGLRTGLLQRFFWPSDLAMPVETVAFGSLLAVIGFTVFFHSFVPGIRRAGGLYRIFMALLAVTLLAQGWSLFVDYRNGAMVWSLSVNGVILVGITLAVLAWRDGMASAGTLVFSFAFLAVLELLRLGAVLGWLPFFWAETMAGPWALVMTTPLILLSIFQRSRELHDKLTRSEQENLAKVEFLAQMSHELRTPLNTILGNAQLLSRPAGDALANDGLQSIQQSGKHLLGMIDEILDHARGIAGKLTLEATPVDWPDFLMSLEHNAQLLAAQNNNRFSLTQEGEPPKFLLFDEGRLRQVLDNLLSNATRHTRNGLIELTVASVSQPDGRVRLSFCVADSGNGIAQKDQERIFLPFERGSNNTRNGSKGTGMGLAIARQLVEAMGGELHVESALECGSRFTFAVCCAIGESAPTVPLAFNWAEYKGSRRQILVVDDDESARNILHQLLSAHGFVTHLTRNGREAIAEMRRLEGIDLVLVDQFMAEGDGWYVLRAVRSLGFDIPVVLMSSALPVRPAGFPPALDFSTFLLKPLDHPTLLRVIGERLHLDWQCAEQAEVDAAAANDAVPDDAELHVLREMIEYGAMTEMMDWAIALKSRQPRYAAFAEKVGTAAYHIDFHALNVLAGVQK